MSQISSDFLQIYNHYQKQHFPISEISNSPHLRKNFTGRGNIIVDIIKNNLPNLLEIDSFLGSYIDFWFNLCPKIKIVSVDSLKGKWDGNHL